MDNQPTLNLRVSSANGNIALVILILFVLACGCPNSNQTSKSTTNAANVNVNTNQVVTANANQATPANVVEPSNLSPKDNLSYVKQAATAGDIGKAKLHLAAIPKGSPEFATASKLIKDAESKAACSSIESELAGVERDQAGVEEMLDATEDFGPQAGSPKKAIYMNALKRKGELQLQHIALERKLKACGGRK